MTETVKVLEVRPLFTVKTLARYLACSERQVRAMLADGRINGFKIGGGVRIEPAEVERYVREQKGEAA